MSGIRGQLTRRRMPAGVTTEGCPDSIVQVEVEEDDRPALKRSMSTLQLTMIGVGGTVGTGIFFILSEAVPEAGPAVLVSFLIAAAVAGLTVLCYAELASTIPSSGSSYSYTYATMGELAAFGVGACLILEYGVSAAAVAVGWSEYLNLLLDNLFGIRFPAELSAAPDAGGVINLPAVILVLMCMALLMRGASESARANALMVFIKVGVLGVFAAIAFTGFNADHFANFAPEGFRGISIAAGSLFFSFIGLDAVATTGDEVKDPKKTIPRALIFALGIVTAVYLIVALAALGAQAPGDFEGQEASLASIVQGVVGSTWPGTLLAVGAVISIFSVTLICMYGQTRILYSMGRDGLVPSVFAKVSPKRNVPLINTFIVSGAVATLAGMLPLGILADMTSIGTLAAFGLVSIGVMVLRKTAPDMHRGFKVPGYPVTPVLSVAACIYVISGLHIATLQSFAVWMAIALTFYFLWSRKHSELARLQREAEYLH
ncbi:MAG: amino acid permease [Ancrocorticia sp.]|uniref:amino acid permease n=1 Tax=Ancrocorticia sp. TaxID=2593684 RepID=UPI003F8F0B02